MRSRNTCPGFSCAVRVHSSSQTCFRQDSRDASRLASVSRHAWTWCHERFLNRGNGCGFGASGNSTGGNPAVPSSEFISARFSARSRATSASSSPTYLVRKACFSYSNIVSERPLPRTEAAFLSARQNLRTVAKLLPRTSRQLSRAKELSSRFGFETLVVNRARGLDPSR